MLKMLLIKVVMIMKKILICNHKMNLSYDEAKNLCLSLNEIDTNNINLILAPSYINFDIFKNYKLAAQNCFYEDHGSYTGEISPYHLSLINIKYCLVGHSERNEDDNLINKKVLALIRNSICPILCIGETKEQRELYKTMEVLRRQITKALKNVQLDDASKIYIAYEPRFLIGGKYALNKDEIEDIFTYIRKLLTELGIKNYKLLYGGSVNSSNIKKIDSKKIDGYLVGNASIDIDEIYKIINVLK